MTRRNLFLFLTAAVLLLSAALYGGAAVRRRFFPRLTAAACRAGVVEETATLPGTVVRTEVGVPVEGSFVRFTVPAGQRCAAGTVLGIAYNTGAEYFRTALLLRLRQETLSREAARAQPLPPTLERRDAAALSRSLARGDFAAVNRSALPLRLALEGTPSGPDAAVRAEIASLAAAGAEAGLVIAPAAGYFVPGPDGAAARIVAGNAWFVRLTADTKTASRLTPGETVDLTLPFGAAEAEVVSVSSSGAAVLACRTALEQVLTAEAMDVTLHFSRTEGLWLPRAALRYDESGSFVYRATRHFAFREDVTVLHEGDEEVLVSSDGLREGSLVLVGDAPLSDGAVWK